VAATNINININSNINSNSNSNTPGNSYVRHDVFNLPQKGGVTDQTELWELRFASCNILKEFQVSDEWGGWDGRGEGRTRRSELPDAILYNTLTTPNRRVAPARATRE